MVLVSPSLLAADFGNLHQQIKMVEDAGADWLHFDIMDGHFVPNISYGPDIVKQMRSVSNLFFDVHLMIENPIKLLPMFLNCGADLITIHYEACDDVSEIISEIKKHNKKVGISVKPNTPIDVLKPYLDDLDVVLIMTVEPGFGGQKFMDNQLTKIKKLREFIGSRNILIEVDGGINAQTAKLCVQNGADVLVAGSAIFKADNPEQIIKELQKAGDE